MNKTELFLHQYQDIITTALEHNHSEKEIFNIIYSKEFSNYLRKGINPRLNELNQVMNFIREYNGEKYAIKSNTEDSIDKYPIDPFGVYLNRRGPILQEGDKTPNDWRTKRPYESGKYCIWYYAGKVTRYSRQEHLDRDGVIYNRSNPILEEIAVYNCHCILEQVDNRIYISD